MGIREIEWQIYNFTVLNPIALSLTLLMCIFVLILKRDLVIVPFIIVACFITDMQRLVIAGLDFNMLRIMVIFGIIRFFIKKDVRSFKLNIIDKFMIFWTFSRMITHTLLWADSGALINSAGFLFDSLGIYLLMRLFLYDINDYSTVIKTLAVCSIVVAVFMFYEQLTGRNFFSVLGGVPEFTVEREGKLRSQGAFSHAIMAGTFGASLIPLMWAIWINKYKFYAMTGIIGGLIITFTSSSSGPVLTLLSSVGWIFLWRFRSRMKFVKWGVISLLIFLHLVMKGPVWTIIGKIDIAGGSSSYHRVALLDQAIRRFPEWMFFGVRSTAHWGWGLQDLTNNYVYEAVYGGIIPLIFFILIMRNCFKAVQLARLKIKQNVSLEKYVWALGAVLFAHAVSFIGVSYFGQMLFFYYLALAMISSLNNLPEITDSNITGNIVDA
ncbi:MAG: hypothetical protein JW864_10165 [Spirochaetes bacterium]|nr:hypothetical protein [Spirochaetota bacterium]